VSKIQPPTDDDIERYVKAVDAARTPEGKQLIQIHGPFGLENGVYCLACNVEWACVSFKLMEQIIGTRRD
jgi:hypothetical protein